MTLGSAAASGQLQVQTSHGAGLARVEADNDVDAGHSSVNCVALVSPDGVAAGVAAALGAPPITGFGAQKVVYLDFDGEVDLSLRFTAFQSLDSDRTITVPPFATSLASTYPSLNATQIESVRMAIVDRVAVDYAPFHVLVTDNEPTAQAENGGDYERLYVGGSRSMFDNPGSTITTSTLGIAEVDLTSSGDPNSIGFVLVEHFGAFVNKNDAGGMMGLVASHEAGHEHGLRHIENNKGRMFALIGTSDPAGEIAETWRAGKRVGVLAYQDSNLLLAQRLDLSSTTSIPSDPTTPDDLGDNYFDATTVDDPTATTPVTVNGDLEVQGDVDVVTFIASRATNVTFTVNPAAGVNVVLAIKDENGDHVTTQDAGGSGSDETANLDTESGLAYFVYVNSAGGSGTGTYTLSMVDETPPITVCPYDLDGDTGVGTGDFTVFSGCWGEVGSLSPPCDQADFDGDSMVATGDFACFAANWTLPCNQVTACGAMGGATAAADPTVEVRVLALAAPSGLERADQPPESMSRVEPGSPFVLELWAADLAGPITELACVYVDLVFDPWAIQLTDQPLVGAALPWFREPQNDPAADQLHNLGGCIMLDANVGDVNLPSWFLVARIHVVAGAEAGRTTLSPIPSATRGLGIARLGQGTVAISDVRFTPLTLTTAVMGDFDADGDVDLSDYLSFQACVSDPLEAQTAHCQAADFDADGDADLADLVAFQSAFTGPK